MIQLYRKGRRQSSIFTPLRRYKYTSLIQSLLGWLRRDRLARLLILLYCGHSSVRGQLCSDVYFLIDPNTRSAPLAPINIGAKACGSFLLLSKPVVINNFYSKPNVLLAWYSGRNVGQRYGDNVRVLYGNKFVCSYRPLSKDRCRIAHNFEVAQFITCNNCVLMSFISNANAEVAPFQLHQRLINSQNRSRLPPILGFHFSQRVVHRDPLQCGEYRIDGCRQEQEKREYGDYGVGMLWLSNKKPRATQPAWWLIGAVGFVSLGVSLYGFYFVPEWSLRSWVSDWIARWNYCRKLLVPCCLPPDLLAACAMIS